MAVSSDAALAGELSAITGAQAHVGAATASVKGPVPSTDHAPLVQGSDPVVGFAASAFPAGALNVSLTLPPRVLRTCGATAGATRMAVVAGVGRRLLESERDGVQARRVLAHVAHDARLRAAVAHRDPVALRAAIVRFFRTRSLHVVRIRATDGRGRLIGDVGGPWVLSPIRGAVDDGQGHRLGRVTLSVQDDSGYVKLLHRFTGAAVQLRAGHRIVPDSNRLPAHPAQRATLNATAFPDGPLTVVVETV